MGLKGVLARLASMWRHRARYAEWRRDVRWAMYNKRVRIATEMFSELFGPDFDAIIPIYPTGACCAPAAPAAPGAAGVGAAA